MKLNWQLLLTLLVLIVGVYLLLAYRDDQKLSPRQRSNYRNKRNIGIALIVISVCLGVYFYYTGRISFKASMPSDCDICKLYVKRHRELRPYHVDEYQKLKNHAVACNSCSRQCFEFIQLVEKDPDVSRAKVQQYKQSCAEKTKHAILAKKELDRLGLKLREQQVRHYQGAIAVGGRPTWDPFPEVPTHIPK